MRVIALVVAGGVMSFVVKLTCEALVSLLELRVVMFFARVRFAFKLVGVKSVYV